MIADTDTRELARRIRCQALRMIHACGSSHIGSCLSIADLLAVLYGGWLQCDPRNPSWEDRDRFVLSKGHAAAILYAVLAERGFIQAEELDSYCLHGSRLIGQTSHKVPGVEL